MTTCLEREKQIVLFFYEELPDPERTNLRDHLRQCESCRLCYERQEALSSVLESDAQTEIPANLLVAARRKFGGELDRLESKKAWWRVPAWWAMLQRIRLLESAALVSIGLAVGVYVTTNRIETVPPSAEPRQEAMFLPDNAVVSNLRIVNANTATGQVELAVELVQPVRIEGSLADEGIRRLLLSALRSTGNPGFRLSAIELLSSEPNDADVKEALIHALTHDSNLGVRFRALQALEPFGAQEKSSPRTDRGLG